jgi:hypothetical protein
MRAPVGARARGGEGNKMSVSSTEHMGGLINILYDRPAGRNVIGHAIDTIKKLRKELDTATSRIDQLEWENKGIAEWREIAKNVSDELAMVRADAERYRWWRDKWDGSSHWWMNPKLRDNPDEADRFIDDEMKDAL